MGFAFIHRLALGGVRRASAADKPTIVIVDFERNWLILHTNAEIARPSREGTVLGRAPPSGGHATRRDARSLAVGNSVLAIRATRP